MKEEDEIRQRRWRKGRKHGNEMRNPSHRAKKYKKGVAEQERVEGKWVDK